MAKIEKIFNQFLKPINKEIDRKTKNGTYKRMHRFLFYVLRKNHCDLVVGSHSLFRYLKIGQGRTLAQNHVTKGGNFIIHIVCDLVVIYNFGIAAAQA